LAAASAACSDDEGERNGDAAARMKAAGDGA
jgi:hypothetical protein